MATPGIKISELTDYTLTPFYESNDDNTDEKFERQKLLFASNNDNYQIDIVNVISDFIAFNFPASKNNLSSSWNLTSSVTANDPKHPIDVANGNVLSGLQNVFNQFRGIWPKIKPPFINKYEPNIVIKQMGTLWIGRSVPGTVQRPTSYGVDVYSVDLDPGGINQIPLSGGFWFPEKGVYMSADQEFDDDILPKLGWIDGESTYMKLTRYEIRPSSPLGTSFNASYRCYGKDRGAGGADDAYEAWTYSTTLQADYCGSTLQGTIIYHGGTHWHLPDSSPNRQNDWWGEGMESNPGIFGGTWAANKDTLGTVASASESIRGNRGAYHGKYINFVSYSVQVWVQEITITEQ